MKLLQHVTFFKQPCTCVVTIKVNKPSTNGWSTWLIQVHNCQWLVYLAGLLSTIDGSSIKLEIGRLNKCKHLYLPGFLNFCTHVRSNKIIEFSQNNDNIAQYQIKKEATNNNGSFRKTMSKATLDTTQTVSYNNATDSYNVSANSSQQANSPQERIILMLHSCHPVFTVNMTWWICKFKSYIKSPQLECSIILQIFPNKYGYKQLKTM